MMKRMSSWAAFFLVMAAGAWAQADKLGVGDAIRVTVFQQPDLTTEARINERGVIADAAGRRGQGGRPVAGRGRGEDRRRA